MTLLTAATINLHNRHHRWRQRRRLLVEQLVDAAPDLISLQEINVLRGQGRWLRSQINLRTSGNTRGPYQLYLRQRDHPLPGFGDGVGILTRLPVLAHDHLRLAESGCVALRTAVVLDSGLPLDFVAVHLQAGPLEQETREEQVRQLLGWLNAPGHARYQLVAGDFNELPHGLAVQQMKEVYRSALVAVRGYEPLATFPTALVATEGWAGCLDYIFYRHGLGTVMKARVFCCQGDPDDETLYPSDHVGLRATFELAE